MHKFNPENKKKLDSEQRRKLLPPEEVLIKYELAKGDSFADIGCGIGYFTIPAAEMIGKESTAYALDISKEMLKEVAERAQNKNINNITLVNTDEYNLKLPTNSVTYGLMCTVLHEIEDKDRFISEASRIIKENGKLVIIDWEKKETEVGPPISHRFSSEETKELLDRHRLEIIYEDSISDIFYGIIATRI